MDGLDPPLDLTPQGRGAAVALLLVGECYALQFRDDRADIGWPGHWGLFGGSVEPGESPRDAIRRELHEELGLEVGDPEELWRIRQYSIFRQAIVRLVVFVADVTAIWPRHVLTEGQEAAAFDVKALPDNTIPLAQAFIERYHATRRERGAGGGT